MNRNWRGRGRFVRVMVVGVAIVLGALTPIAPTSTLSAAAAGPACSTFTPGAPMLVTATCVDPRYNDPYVDIDEQRTTPVPHNEFRLYFIDHAQHTPPVGVPAQARTVSYQGALEQALRDVSAWVERGAKPPASTNYKMVDSQVDVPQPAPQRAGIQPVVTLTANGAVRADVAVGTPVTFTAVVEAPPNTGKVVAAEWDFEGVGNYPVAATLADTNSSRLSLTTTYSFSKPGIYFPVLRAVSLREGDPKTPWGRVQNIGRVRVVVK